MRLIYLRHVQKAVPALLKVYAIDEPVAEVGCEFVDVKVFSNKLKQCDCFLAIAGAGDFEEAVP